MMHRRTLLAAGLAGPLAIPALAQATWPDRPIRFVISAQVGGVSDIFIRIMENRLREKLGQTLYVDPRPGGGGVIAAEAAIRAGDGHHSFLLNHIAGHGIGPTLFRNRRSYEPLRDMPGICRIARMPNVLVVKGDAPVNSPAELVAYIKANPRRATFSSAGSGTSSQLSGLLFGQRMGVEVTHVPYRGTAPAMAAVLNGEVLFNIDNAPVSRQQVVAGNLKALGVSTAERSALLPELATLQEQGVPDFDVSSWYGIAAPSAMPRAIVERMATAVLETIAESAVATRFNEFGAETWPLGTDGYNAFMRAEVAKWAPLVIASGASLE